MLKLTAPILVSLGAPHKCGAQDIEDWLRALLKPGAVRLEDGLIELRGAEPIVTTLGELKKACGVAVETIKHGLRALEMEHWVSLVDGAHTRLLGPPRFRVSITKENLWGSVGRAIEVAHADGLSPLESLDYDQLRRADNISDCKSRLALEHVTLQWIAEVRLPNRTRSTLQPDEVFTLAAGSELRDELGHCGILEQDLRVRFANNREAEALGEATLSMDNRKPLQLSSGAAVLLGQSSIVRLASGVTGILEVRPQTILRNNTESTVVDWQDDSHWLSRFRGGRPLVFLRRAIYVVLKDVVSTVPPVNHPPPQNEWRIAVGIHDCFLDGGIPAQAGQCSPSKSADRLLSFLSELGTMDSLRESVANAYGFTVGSTDVRISPAALASTTDRELLAQVGQNPRFSSEVLSLSHRVPCWAQVGAYYRSGDPYPWEITRELYFTFVDVRYRQGISA